jgi:hypothetical protein
MQALCSNSKSKVDDMLSGKKLNQVCEQRNISDSHLAEHLAHGG